MLKIDLNNLPKYAHQALEKPSDFGYWGNEDMFKTWGFTGIDQHRDSFILDRCNFEVITKDLMKRYPNDFRIETYSHWACGSVDRLVCRILKNFGDEIIEENITSAFIAAMNWHNELGEYPIADEDRYEEMLFEDGVDSMKYLPFYLVNLIDQSVEDWHEKIYHEIHYNMRIEDYDIQDDDIRMAIYQLQIWNEEEVDDWKEFTDRYNLESIPLTKVHPDQLKLFED